MVNLICALIKIILCIFKSKRILVCEIALLKKENEILKRKRKKRGRKTTSKNIQNLILSIKNDNILWGVKKIQGELRKLDIYLDTKTMR